MSTKTIYRPSYTDSHALVIGINKYEVAPPLGYARQDAEAVAKVLVERFQFPSAKVTTLFDEEATYQRIRSSFLSYADAFIKPDDRLVVFFAGHGCTRAVPRGQVGYLVPVDGDPDALSTLLRWDDLTRNAELIPAKHVLFLMDACYGGLALGRGPSPGGARFLRDMLQRYSRQVLTAGKADETVADAGGPRAGHSVFTGHLLDALEGKAATPDGIVSTNAVMAYVYDRVSKDPHSNQSPHYGFIDGDGDLILAAPALEGLDAEQKTGTDILVEVPADLKDQASLDNDAEFTGRAKTLLSDPAARIQLYDLVTAEIRAALSAIKSDDFGVQAPVDAVEFASRLKRYETATTRLRILIILLARWATEQQVPMVARIVSRLADANELVGGTTVWLGLRWYPLLSLIYCGGLAALAGDNFASLGALLMTKVGSRTTGERSPHVVEAAVDGMSDVGELFKRLPGHEKYFVPRSEYLFKAIQPALDDILYLGNSYEDLFDHFEVLLALTYADLLYQQTKRMWGPPGRFGWKRLRGHGGDPYNDVVRDFSARGAEWGPLKGGLFGASPERLKPLLTAYANEVLNRLPWS